jgi:predicted nucleotidyltransferase
MRSSPDVYNQGMFAETAAMTETVLKTPPSLDELRAQRHAILAIAARHKAANVRVFGSLVRGEARPGSDIDLLVTYQQGASLFDVAGLLLDLQDLLGVSVDVVDDSAIRARYRESILGSAVPL